MNQSITNSFQNSPDQVIVRLRGHSVILDSDLAALYGVTPKRLNEQVKRNTERFPHDFVFQLTETEWKSLRSQIATSNRRGGRRYLPYAFTEHGAIMAATVLNSPQAIARKVHTLERQYDGQFTVVFDALRRLMASPSEKPKGKIGFHP